ncbi:hypothetical protein, partial [Salmonella enterica]|uniref:hypothetical protein n=1 Tax=Salmonella enterica TaxID=28901 RepID=UPI00300F7DB3
MPLLLSSRHNTGVITLLFQLQVQSTALYGLLPGKLTFQPDPVQSLKELLTHLHKFIFTPYSVGMLLNRKH